MSFKERYLEEVAKAELKKEQAKQKKEAEKQARLERVRQKMAEEAPLVKSKPSSMFTKPVLVLVGFVIVAAVAIQNAPKNTSESVGAATAQQVSLPTSSSQTDRSTREYSTRPATACAQLSDHEPYQLLINEKLYADADRMRGCTIIPSGTEAIKVSSIGTDYTLVLVRASSGQMIRMWVRYGVFNTAFGWALNACGRAANYTDCMTKANDEFGYKPKP